MTTQEAVAHYGSQHKLATALGIKQASVSGWGVYPPAIRQIQLQRLTRSRLKAEPGILDVKAA
jgi:DNA-binding transcriptional regulator YdaS (Cro superfamily)